MEKPKIIEAINGELPEETIQHIQSYLSGKEAARTTILSKSWYTAWLTRPNLDIDENDIRTTNFAPSQSKFMKFAKKTMQRYEELGLNIRSFKLGMRLEGICVEDICVEWMNGKRLGETIELIQKAVKLGATDLVIEITKGILFQIPPQVFESVVNLSLTSCYMNARQYAAVRFSRLKSLTFHKVRINLMDLIEMCPVIEKLVLTECNLHYAFEWLVLEPRDFHKLEVLVLSSLNKVIIIGECLFRDLSSGFPCLQDLALYNCFGYGKIQICSNSLERISINDHLEKFEVEFDVPRIKKFRFSTSSVPSQSFKTTSTEWESDINIECNKETDVREFLQNLSPSKIGLSEEYDYAGAIIGLCHKPPITIVEKLTIHMYAPSSGFGESILVLSS